MCSEDRIWAILASAGMQDRASTCTVMMALIVSEWSRDIGDQVRVVLLLSNRFERA